MTEAEWLTCYEPDKMLWSLSVKPSPRKQRLYAVACCRRIWEFLYEAVVRPTVVAIERMADEHATEEDWKQVMATAAKAGWDENGHSVIDPGTAAVSAACWGYDADVAATLAANASGREDEPVAQAALLRDVLGNPFRPVTFSPSWRTSTVVALAEAIYADRAFDRLPILADALQDAGCEDEAILSHCRGPGPHARGCWVVDMVTGRE